METRGRKKKTKEQKRLEGTLRADRDSRSLSADMTMPIAPSFLDEDEFKIWSRLAPRLNKRGVLSYDDADSFGWFCVALNRLIYAKRECTNDVYLFQKWFAIYDKLGAKFGYTPADRASLKIDSPKKDDPLDALLKRRSG